jgi:magnesium chelatase accessory protein
MIGPLLVNCGRPDWGRDGADWPNRDHSRFVTAAGLRWHVQEFGQPGRPVALLLHGTGAATHSWRDLAPLLAGDYRVVAPDLPGHGFSEGNRPAVVVGHSAGAAIALQLVVDGRAAPDRIVALNGALLPFEGVMGRVAPPIAKLMFLNPLTPRVLAFSAADRRRVRRLITGTGSTLDATGLALYERLLKSPAHIAGTLGMMAAWDLGPLVRALPGMTVPVTLVVGERDRAVPPSQADTVAAKLPEAKVVRLPGLGHLAHEEDPAAVAGLIRDMLPDPA